MGHALHRGPVRGVGSVVALVALFSGPVCSACMNPARSLAPAAVSGQLDHMWVNLAAPTIGGCLAVEVYIDKRGCCTRARQECHP